MAGPYPPYRPGGTDGHPVTAPGYGSPEAYPYPGSYPGPYPGAYPGAYPGQLPPPVGFSKPARSRKVLWGGLLGIALVGALIAAVLTVGGDRTSTAGFSDSASKAAIQGYLTALSTGDSETIARNNACGMFDAIKDRKSDLALARLASDAFRKQFQRADVTSIDETVLVSSYQAQVLFTMKAIPAANSRPAREEEQGVAQLLRQGKQLLVCSYLRRTAAQY
ncbi:hypothetical protein [Mycolicibacterium sp.]|uniref:Rv0361 family membrane protein n=1 Tax=Mycolicibacterium sp. TaxID=2320850 RepID=UPI001A2CBBD7|nr:hypothetical protein [Mycolicibacterium sp.]MBJ7400574.1 hypothetical protein [Mycolicibacterium sp.]